MSFISSIGLAVPANKFAQAQISAFMERLAPTEEIRKTIHTVFRASGIRTRYSVLSDYGKEGAFDFFPNTEGLDPFPGTSLRMKEFRKHAVGLSLDAVRNCLATSTVRASDITHLITVSCTGMYAPGLDLDLVNLLSLKTSINRTCINFMGCFAAISAIKTAYSFCVADPTAKVLIVCTELCSLHFQKEFTDDTILSNALFGDGSGAVLVEAKPTAQALLKIESSHSEILQNGSEHMAWTIGDLGFEMKLSSYVADVLSHEVGSLVMIDIGNPDMNRPMPLVDHMSNEISGLQRRSASCRWACVL